MGTLCFLLSSAVNLKLAYKIKSIKEQPVELLLVGSHLNGDRNLNILNLEEQKVSF